MIMNKDFEDLIRVLIRLKVVNEIKIANDGIYYRAHFMLGEHDDL